MSHPRRLCADGWPLNMCCRREDTSVLSFDAGGRRGGTCEHGEGQQTDSAMQSR